MTKIIQCVRKVTVHLQKVLEVMSTSIHTGLNLCNFIRKHFLQICSWDVSYKRSYCSINSLACVCRDRHRTLNGIKTEINVFIANSSLADLQKVFENKIQRVQACIDARGHHFKHLLLVHSDFPNADLHKSITSNHNINLLALEFGI
jgi:hypothetical protein